MTSQSMQQIFSSYQETIYCTRYAIFGCSLQKSLSSSAGKRLAIPVLPTILPYLLGKCGVRHRLPVLLYMRLTTWPMLLYLVLYQKSIPFHPLS
jgi:hypothetical protein